MHRIQTYTMRLQMSMHYLIWNQWLLLFGLQGDPLPLRQAMGGWIRVSFFTAATCKFKVYDQFITMHACTSTSISAIELELD